MLKKMGCYKLTFLEFQVKPNLLRGIKKIETWSVITIVIYSHLEWVLLWTFSWTTAGLVYIGPAGSWGFNEKQLFFQITHKKRVHFIKHLLNLTVRLFIFIFSALIMPYLCGKYKHSGERQHLKEEKTQRTNVSLEVAHWKPRTDN